MPIGDVILDGEITAADQDGLPNFEALARGDCNYLHTFWTFDLSQIGKCDLRGLALEERKTKLADLLSGVDSVHVRYSVSFEDRQALLEAVTRLGMEGVVSKKRGSAYRSGRCRDWLKVKSAVWRKANRERWNLFKRQG